MSDPLAHVRLLCKSNRCCLNYQAACIFCVNVIRIAWPLGPMHQRKFCVLIFLVESQSADFHKQILVCSVGIASYIILQKFVEVGHFRSRLWGKSCPLTESFYPTRSALQRITRAKPCCR